MSPNRLLVLFVLAAFAGQIHAAEPVAEGDAAVAKFNLTAAADSYRAARQAAPDNYEATWKLARTLMDQGTLEKDSDKQKAFFIEAEQLARLAVQQNSKDSKGHVFLSIAVGNLSLFESGKRKVELSKEIKTEAEKAIELNPQDDVAWHVLGVWNREMTELNWMMRKVAEMLYGSFPAASLETAEADLKKSATLMPAAVAHQVELGLTIAAAHRWADAKTALDKAMKMPKTWATDDIYKAKAKEELAHVNSRLQD